MKLERITLAFLGAALVGGAALVAVPAPASDPASAPLPGTATPRAALDERAARERGNAQRERAQLLAFGRDPFRAPASAPSEPAPVELASSEPAPPAEAAPTAPLPSLTGISSYDGIRWAIIDREIVREGQRLSSGFTVERIEQGRVILRRDQEEEILVLGEQP